MAPPKKLGGAREDGHDSDGGGERAAGGAAGGAAAAAAAVDRAPAAVKRLFSDLDKYFEDAPLAQHASKLTGLRPSVLAVCLAAFLIISLGTGFGGGLVCDVAGFLYPAWMSFRAIESPGREDDKLWLTYWVVYGAFSILEYFVDFILFWVPFYYLFKFCFLLYLGLPCFKGAESVYNCLVRPFLLQHQQPIDSYLEKIEAAGTKAAENLQQAVQQGIGKVQDVVGVVRRK
ncbi:hypothetical protein, conserved [Eimeria brunetti]|uniref:TB2/DP1, HVA22 domain-containing protein n=1 Tax=Eimeria brunetti TaxID=51314 RepID=U6LK63_9EIME|nr:hypothetical protein, conserved [Eimeria brunetti]